MLERTAVASLLLEQKGIDVNIVARGAETALHEAARHNKTSECLTSLLARPDWGQPEGLGWTDATLVSCQTQCNDVRPAAPP